MLMVLTGLCYSLRITGRRHWHYVRAHLMGLKTMGCGDFENCLKILMEQHWREQAQNADCT